MKAPRGGGGGGEPGDPDGGPPGRRVSGTLVVALMLAVTIAMWAFFTWLASSRFEGLHVVTLRSEYPGEVRVLGLAFGDEAAWQVAFLDRYPSASTVTRDEWVAARTEASWLEQGFFSGRSLQRVAERPGFTYCVQLRGPGATSDPQIVHVPFLSRHETSLVVDEQGRLWVSTGAIATASFLATGPLTADEWAGVRTGALREVPGADDGLLPDLQALPFRESPDS